MPAAVLSLSLIAAVVVVAGADLTCDPGASPPTYPFEVYDPDPFKERFECRTCAEQYAYYRAEGPVDSVPFKVEVVHAELCSNVKDNRLSLEILRNGEVACPCACLATFSTPSISYLKQFDCCDDATCDVYLFHWPELASAAVVEPLAIRPGKGSLLSGVERTSVWACGWAAVAAILAASALRW